MEDGEIQFSINVDGSVDRSGWPRTLLQVISRPYTHQLANAHDSLLAKLKTVEQERDTAIRERDALAKDELMAAVNRAARDLPWGYEVSIVVERGSGWVDLHDGEGHKIECDDDDCTIARKVHIAIDAALKAAP